MCDDGPQIDPPLTLPEQVDASRQGPLFGACMERGVICVPGEYCFHGPDAPRNHVRLSFGQVPRQRIGEGMRRLGEAVRAVAAGATPGRPPAPAAQEARA